MIKFSRPIHHFDQANASESVSYADWQKSQARRATNSSISVQGSFLPSRCVLYKTDYVLYVASVTTVSLILECFKGY